MINRFINRLLYRYNASTFLVQSKARFILYLILSIILLTPVFIIYYSAFLYKAEYGDEIIFFVIGPMTAAFFLSIAMLYILYLGHYSLAGNLLLVIWQTALWGIIFLSDEESLIRVDTTILIIAVLTIMPVIIVHQKKLFIFYCVLNIAVLFVFMFRFKDELNISGIAFNDFLSVNIIAISLIGIISYTIYSINSKSLERAEREISEREKTEYQRNKLQMQLVQSQKLESVGLLAGGVAHDFNNILAAIQGFAELAADKADDDSMLKKEIYEIISASKKARDLTRQLLAFARIQPLNIRNLDLNSIIRNFTNMLSRTLRENIIIKTDLCEAPGSVEGDPVQIEQVLLNLTLNSQDAMPDGGTITIRTSIFDADEDFVKKFENVPAGRYLLMSVSDSGSGIDSRIMNNIFDPFFTTKEFGKGTGLGLSTVYGIIKQHNGMIDFQSEIKSGTTFNIYLPLKNAAAAKESPAAEKLIHAAGKETILVVEDNKEVRHLIENILNKTGYTSFIAESAEAAIKIASTYEGIIHLLITDVIIPDMNGMQLYEKICAMRPEIKLIYISGYAANLISNDEKNDIRINFIQKPFAVSDFTRKIREVLDE